MSDKKHEPVFIPCGDSFEKMNEINDAILEALSIVGDEKPVVDVPRPDQSK